MANVYEMKDSGVEWIGKVPKGWKMDDIGSLYSLRNTKVSDKEYTPLSVTKKGILPQLETVAKTDDGDNRKLVKVGDFAINSRSDRRGSCGISEYDGSVSLINTVLTPRGEMNPGYYNWLFHTEQFADEFYKWGHGIVDDLWTTRWSEMKRIIVPTPKTNEQAAIAAYLDEKCAAIDDIVAEAKATIEEYKKWKASVIFEAVTKGLDPNAEMKDSGVEWIGMVPKGWKVNPLKFVSTCNDEVLSENTQPDFEFDYIDIGNVHSNNGIGQCERMQFKDAPSRARRIVKPGDVIVSTVRTYLKAIAQIEDYKFPQIASTGFAVIRAKNINASFLRYALTSDNFVSMVEAESTGISYPAITSTLLMTLKLPCPNSEIEQTAIAAYLDEKCAAIDGIIAEKEALITELESYKKSLIFETVTGKRRVC